MLAENGCAIIEGEKKRASRELPILADPHHITVRKVRRHDYPHFITQSNTVTFSHSGGAIMPTRLPEEKYRDLAKARGFVFVGPYTGSVRDKVTWRCSAGHEWEAPYKNVCYCESGCPYCAGTVPKTEADYKAVAEQHGFVWVSEKIPEDIDGLTNWLCPEGHLFDSTYHRVSRGQGCRYCNGGVPLAEDDYRALAESKGIEYLGPFPNNNRSKTTWRCARGHEWRASYASVITTPNTGCVKCMAIENSGPNNHNWNPDKTDEERNDDRKYKEYDHWRKAVYERDDYTCQVCGAPGPGIIAHHIYSYTDNPSLRLDVDNGVALCEGCHNEYHSTYGMTGANAMDFLDFISRRKNSVVLTPPL